MHTVGLRTNKVKTPTRREMAVRDTPGPGDFPPNPTRPGSATPSASPLVLGSRHSQQHPQQDHACAALHREREGIRSNRPSTADARSRVRSAVAPAVQQPWAPNQGLQLQKVDNTFCQWERSSKYTTTGTANGARRSSSRSVYVPRRKRVSKDISGINPDEIRQMPQLFAAVPARPTPVSLGKFDFECGYWALCTLQMCLSFVVCLCCLQHQFLRLVAAAERSGGRSGSRPKPACMAVSASVAGGITAYLSPSPAMPSQWGQVRGIISRVLQ
jgi:hypothetical protein